MNILEIAVSSAKNIFTYPSWNYDKSKEKLIELEQLIPPNQKRTTQIQQLITYINLITDFQNKKNVDFESVSEETVVSGCERISKNILRETELIKLINEEAKYTGRSLEEKLISSIKRFNTIYSTDEFKSLIAIFRDVVINILELYLKETTEPLAVESPKIKLKMLPNPNIILNDETICLSTNEYGVIKNLSSSIGNWYSTSDLIDLLQISDESLRGAICELRKELNDFKDQNGKYTILQNQTGSKKRKGKYRLNSDFVELG